MKFLLRTKERIKSFYERYSQYCDMLIRFIFALVTFLTVMYNAGYNAALTNPLIATGMAFICAFLPVPAIPVFTGVLLIIEMVSVSIEIAVVIAVFLIVMLLMYFIFRSGKSWLLSFSLVLCLFRFSPAILPVALLIEPLEILAVVFGILLYGFVIVVMKDVSVLASQTGNLTLGGRINLFMTDVFTSNRFYLILISVVVAMLLIAFLRKSKINFANLAAIVAGDVLFLIVYLVGAFFFNISFDLTLFIIAFVLNIIASWFIVNFVLKADYNRTEEVQFEDDEYYYFVKAIPKVSIAVTSKKVENITKDPEKRPDGNGGDSENFDYNDLFIHHEEEKGGQNE